MNFIKWTGDIGGDVKSNSVSSDKIKSGNLNRNAIQYNF